VHLYLLLSRGCLLQGYPEGRLPLFELERRAHIDDVPLLHKNHPIEAGQQVRSVHGRHHAGIRKQAGRFGLSSSFALNTEHILASDLLFKLSSCKKANFLSAMCYHSCHKKRQLSGLGSGRIVP
jgi:hypothetical protein